MSNKAMIPPDLDRLKQSATDLMNSAMKAGADAAEVVISKSSSFSVSARMGKVETSEKSEDDSASLRVFIGGKVAAISSKADRLVAEGPALVERALAMAAAAPDDPFAGLADKASIATTWPDLDLHDTSVVDADDLASAALELEAIALDHEGITNSSGSSAAYGAGGMVLAASNGFTGAYVGTHHSRSVSVVAGSGTSMERD
ncbi:MAG: TldD/PmbA family protein, partial [Rhizobiales bacterium]|nr:TldD/PmbA family protein [Hyphomicrobiales bacterium]